MSLYRVNNAKGRTLCFQVARNQDDAISTAKNYGHLSAAFAEHVRAD